MVRVDKMDEGEAEVAKELTEEEKGGLMAGISADGKSGCRG